MKKRNKFSLSHTKLLSCNMGNLVPIGLTEVLPGDTVQQATTCMIRFSPLLAPVMHPTHVNVSHWFVPHRLVWESWEDFITGGSDGNNASVFPFIDMGVSGAAVGSLADYLGVPTGVADLTVSALPFRGYGLIWNEWFRDQDLETELTVSVADDEDTTTNTAMQRVAWEKDYFTTARPWEQKGASITVPIGDTAPVASDTPLDGTEVSVYSTAGSSYQKLYTGSTNASLALNAGLEANQLYADLASATGVSINLLREAFALQRFAEARARYGSRYVEYLRSLGVRSSDARLQRPEFLGGGRYPVQFSEVLQTAEGTNPVGELRGHGIGVARSNRYRRFFEEHGYVFSFVSVKPKTIYADGLHRTWNRRAKEDFFQMELQHIGQQEVLYKEVYAAHSTPDGTFGYQDRYDEYRRMPSSISGEFRNTLDFWHFARRFSSDPALNASFVSCVPPTDPFASTSTDTLYILAKHSMQARRLLSARGNSFIY